MKPDMNINNGLPTLQWMDENGSPAFQFAALGHNDLDASLSMAINALNAEIRANPNTGVILYGQTIMRDLMAAALHQLREDRTFWGQEQ